MQDQYNKNLDSIKIVNPLLFEALSQITTNKKFEVFSTEEEYFVKILDVEREVWVSHVDIEASGIKSEELKHYREYPFLYFFGLGNGFVINKLLENKNHKQIVIVEPELEMIYIALNFMDVAEDLLSRRLVIILQEKFNRSMAINVFHSSNARFYSKLFKLHTVDEYYEKYMITEYKKVLECYLGTIEHMITSFGNNVVDSLVGLKHHIKNLPRMISHPKYTELLKSKNSDLAVIVSTGPSLYKQLSVLKDVSDYVTIICVDASFPILSKYGIKPDIVVSMERDEPTSKFFLETSKEDHKDIIFLCASLQHESVLNAIKDGQLVLSMRPFEYNYYFELSDYGYVCAGMSAANMAHELAAYMGYKTCAFIGQDLAYGKDGASHSKGHVFGADQIKDGVDSGDNDVHYETILLPAYGNKGTVESMQYWKIFLMYIEQAIEQTKDEMQSINATEGGVHMRGSIERPFIEVAEQYRLKKKKKKIVLSELSKGEVKINREKVKEKIHGLLQEGEALKYRIDETFTLIADECMALENLPKEEALKVFDLGKTVALLDEISMIRKHIEENEIYSEFISNLSKAILYEEEFKLAEIKVRYVDNPEDNQLKAVQWILEHRYWLFSLSGVIENILHIVKEEGQPYMD